MKTWYPFFILLLFSNLLNAQYNISVEAPLNENPINFHRDHFNIKGAVNVFENSTEKYTFNRKGYLIKQVTLSNNYTTNFIYDTNNNLKYMTSGYGNSSTLKYKIILDEKGRPVEKTNNYLYWKYEYDSQGNYSKVYNKHYLGEYELIESYKYDQENRLIKKQYFLENEESFNITYFYKKEGEYIQVTKHFAKKNKEVITNTLYYKDGFYFGENISDNLKFDKYGNPLELLGKSGLPYASLIYIYFPDNESENLGIINQDSYCESGDCQNGWGLRKYENNYYEGFWKNGLKDGYGSYYWKDGSMYIGNWLKDKMSGVGNYFDRDSYELLGEFKDNKVDGFSIVSENNEMTFRIYKDGSIEQDLELPLNGLEVGCLRGDCLNGIGLYKWENGNVFLGKWKNGKQLFGMNNFYNGAVYFGYVSESGEFTIFGSYTFKNGDRYFGEFKNNTYHGRGYFYNKETDEEFIGIWENGVLKTSFKN